MAIQRIYSSFELLEEAVINKSEKKYFKTIYNIAFLFSDVIINFSDKEILEKVKSNPVLLALLKRPELDLIGMPDFFENLKEESLELFTNDIFLCNEDDEFCNNKLTEYGVFITNSNLLPNIFNTLLSLSFDKTLTKYEDSNNHKYYCWKNLIKENIYLPCNCAVVVDNYIIDNYERYKNENLFSLVQELIPDQLKVPFHLTLVIDNREANKNKTFYEKKLIPELYEHIKSTTGNDIQIEIITHSMNSQIHQRAIILSHFFIVSDKGFKIFENGVVINDTVFYSDWNYFKIDETFKGELKINRNRDYLRKIEKQMLKSQGGNDYHGRLDFYLSSNGKSNRIFS